MTWCAGQMRTRSERTARAWAHAMTPTGELMRAGDDGGAIAETPTRRNHMVLRRGRRRDRNPRPDEATERPLSREGGRDDNPDI